MISNKQKKILAFPYSRFDSIICDGSVRSGKTSIMMWAFVDWAMREFDGQRFGICGKTVDSASKNIIIKHSPSDEELFKLMQSIDLAAQLRKNPHGESSGCIAQLLGLNKKILTTENFVDNKFKDFVYTLPSDADTEDLEKKILFCLQEPDKLNNLYEEYSYEKLAELLYNETIAGEYLLN